MGKNLLENFWTKTPVEATALINKALRSKTVEAIGEARKQVAAEMFGELDEWDNRTDAEKRAPYDGPTPRGKHSHRCTGCKKAYGQTNAVACYKKNCNAPKLTDSCSHCRSAMEKALSKNEAERLTPTVADKDRPSQKQYNSMSKQDKWNAPMPWPKGDTESRRSSAIGDFGDKKRAQKVVKPMAEDEMFEAMSKKDFVAAADHIRNTNAEKPGHYSDDHINSMADHLGTTNPKFNRQRWIDYVKGTGGPSGGKKGKK